MKTIGPSAVIPRCAFFTHLHCHARESGHPVLPAHALKRWSTEAFGGYDISRTNAGTRYSVVQHVPGFFENVGWLLIKIVKNFVGLGGRFRADIDAELLRFGEQARVLHGLVKCGLQ